MSLMRAGSGIFLGILIMSMLVLTGCDQSPEPTSSGGTGTSSINLSQPSLSPASIDDGGTTIVEITVTNAVNNPIAGETVVFAVNPSNGGTFTPATAVTDASGIASAVFSASQTGSLQISGAIGTSTSAYTNLNVSATGQTTSGNLTLETSPSLLTADGASSSVVVIRVSDDLGNPAPDSTSVKLTAGERFLDMDFNGYYTAGIDTLKIDYNGNQSWDPIGIIPAIAYTTAGTCAVTYTAGTEATTAYIKATVTGTTDFSGTVETSMQLTPDAAIFSIYLDVDDPGIQVQGTGGVEMTNLRAICYDVNGNTVPEGVDVSFVITDGPGGGENISGSGAGPVVSKTNSVGEAYVPVWAGTISGTLRARASAGTVLSNATFLAIHAGPPYYIMVGVALCNIPGWNTVNMENQVTAVVSDYYNNPVQENTAVYFTVDEGVMQAFSTTIDNTGVATAVFRTGSPQSDGVVYVIAETSGGQLADTSIFYNSYGTSTISFSITGGMIMADGESGMEFGADLRDLNGNYVVGGSAVEGDAVYGSVSADASVDGCLASISDITYTSSILKQDFSLTGANDNGIGAIDYITINAGFSSNTVVCTLLTASAYSDASYIKVENSIPFDAAGNVAAVVIKDRYTNPLGDHTLVATISAGTITTASSETDGFGEANGIRFDAPSQPPPDTVIAGSDTTITIYNTLSAILTITDTDARGGIVLTAPIVFHSN